MTVHASQLRYIIACGAAIEAIDTSGMLGGGHGESYGEKSGAAELGTALHDLARRMVRGAPTDPEEIAPAYGIKSTAELWFLLTSLRRTWETLAEHFPAPQAEIYMGCKMGNHDWLEGTADVLAADPEGHTVRLLDWKSGRVEGDSLPQMMGYAALAFAEFPWADRAYICVAWLRAGETDARWVTRQQADEFVSRIQQALRRPDEYRYGDHCQWCPRHLDCPALTRAAGALMQPEETLPEITAENAIRVHSLLKAVESRCRAVNSALRAFIRATGPVATGDDGKLLGFRRRRTEKIDFVAAVEWLMYRYPHTWAGTCQVSKGAVEKMVAAGAEPGTKGKAVAAALDELRARGAVTEVLQDYMTVYRPDPD